MLFFCTFLLLSGRKNATAATAATIKQHCPSLQLLMFTVFLPPNQILGLTSPQAPRQTGCCCQPASPPYRRSINTSPPQQYSPSAPYHQLKVGCIQIAVRYGRVEVLVVGGRGSVVEGLTGGNHNLWLRRVSFQTACFVQSGSPDMQDSRRPCQLCGFRNLTLVIFFPFVFFLLASFSLFCWHAVSLLPWEALIAKIIIIIKKTCLSS